jgi:hypothetical protein
MDTLDKNRLDSLVEAFSSAKKLGFESLSSPVEILLEAAIDLGLLLEKAFKEGRLGQKANPSIKFLDVSDDLGNPKQITLHKKRRIWFEPRIAEFFKQFAAFCVLVKKSSEEALSFMESMLRTRFLETPVNTPDQEAKIQRIAAKSSKEKKAAYYRRLRKKRTKNQKLN